MVVDFVITYAARVKSAGSETVSVQGVSPILQPRAGRLAGPVDAFERAPECRGMIHFGKMCNLMRGHVTQHLWRCHHQPPGKHQTAP